jgi:hypothetical protein
MVRRIGMQESKYVIFHASPSETLNDLTKLLSSGYDGCVHFHPSSTCDIRILILLYSIKNKELVGFIPNNQVVFEHRLKELINQSDPSRSSLPNQQQLNANQQMQDGSLQNVINRQQWQRVYSLQHQQLGIAPMQQVRFRVHHHKLSPKKK